jgi:hypothetical protein
METPNILRQTVIDLIQKTNERKIIWTVANPNVIRWVKQEQDDQTTVTLQKQPGPNPNVKELYIMTIQSIRMVTVRANAPGQPPGTKVIPMPTAPIQISTMIDTSLSDVLKELFAMGYSEAHRQDDEIKIEALRKLLRGL